MTSATWLRTGMAIPTGGLSLTATYKRGSGSSHVYISTFDNVFQDTLGGPLFAGSFNLWCDAPIDLPSPAAAFLLGMNWQFVPIVLANAQVGIVARRPDQDKRYLEIFARHKLVDRLGLAEGDKVDIRLLSGDCLELAA